MPTFQIYLLITIAVVTSAVQFSANPSSDMSWTDDGIKDNKTMEQSDESGHEIETDLEEKDKKFLDDAMKTIMDPHSIILKHDDDVEALKVKIKEIDSENMTLNSFMSRMDQLSLDVCKMSQQALWSYVTDISNEVKRNKMIEIAAEEDDIKKQYWNTLKHKYYGYINTVTEPNMKRKIRIIKERGASVQMPQSKQREEIDKMQHIWSRVAVCAYNSSCESENAVKTMSDIINVFKTSNDSEELSFYWKAYRDMTGRKIRPIFKDYVTTMNMAAKSENFTDAGDMWRYVFDDEDFISTVDRLWKEIKPLYNLLHDYVRNKLKLIFVNNLKGSDNMIPAQLLGNIWAQEWQALYQKVAPYPDYIRQKIGNQSIRSKQLFDIVDEFHQSIGFESAKDSYKDIKETMATTNCLPSSHDMCDGKHYRIKWCGEKVTDVVISLSRAARLLGHVQYFMHYRHLPPLYRDGPNPAFHDAISDIVAMQLTSPMHLKRLNLIKTGDGPESLLNHLTWVALEKISLIAYSYILDKWRWDVFRNSSLQNWNEHWWNLRINETGVSPPVPRNESDLDPAAKYHVVSHVQYITYMVSHVLEFQILRSLCRRANHTGPLHNCSIYGDKEAGQLLSKGMSLGASKDWRAVLQTMTGETELSTAGILEYFSGLQQFIERENSKLLIEESDDMDQTTPIIVGAFVVVLTLVIIIIYCVKKQNLGGKCLSLCGLSTNGSLDIATYHDKNKKADCIGEEKL
ncbi:hypothetical protein ACJJTC_019805 [Scirpophaga incertulas]